jgi:hypothetical protein
VDWGDLLAGATLGFLLSLLLWWIQLRVVVPKLEFANGISRLTADGETLYRFKVYNRGRRGAVDLRFSVSLHLGKGIITYVEEPRVDTFSILSLYTPTEGVLRLRPAVSRVVRLDMRSCRWQGKSPRLLQVVGIDPSSDADVSLESLLDATPGAYLQIQILAYDDVSGSRRSFVSQRYYRGHIRTGRFHGLVVGSPGGW